MTLLQYERGMDGSENVGGPGFRVYCQVRARYSERKRSDGTRSRHTLRHRARGPGLYCSSGPGSGGSGGSGLVSGVVLVGCWAISGSKCEPVIDIEVRQRARARTSLAPTPVPRRSYSAPDALQSAMDADISVGRPGHGPMRAAQARPSTTAFCAFASPRLVSPRLTLPHP
ncbi:hypothetical protein B0J13DRAFT_236505 [Dactylonectria estremocensis]|uniref:Uncharacterized protein n=1 Tax=Dactylonectria estremocensis TaxID=1079267 RepID=A0A9P9D9K5_9HYPO|nr:hypothetical protein B0J13DRAFT_236505 [Dactylonectria estremocensis]